MIQPKTWRKQAFNESFFWLGVDDLKEYRRSHAIGFHRSEVLPVSKFL